MSLTKYPELLSVQRNGVKYLPDDAAQSEILQLSRDAGEPLPPGVSRYGRTKQWCCTLWIGDRQRKLLIGGSLYQCARLYRTAKARYHTPSPIGCDMADMYVMHLVMFERALELYDLPLPALRKVEFVTAEQLMQRLDGLLADKNKKA
jgi:hypothetical protein